MVLFVSKILRRLSFAANKFINKMKIFYFLNSYRQRLFVAANLRIGKSFALFFDISHSEIILGTDVIFRDICNVRSEQDSKIIIGDRVFFNNGCSINCFQEIIIGNDCLFGEGVKFYDHNHKYKSKSKKISEQGYTTGSIKIGNNCWFGSNVIILKNVTVGDNVVVGANCIIHKSIPADMIVTNKQNISVNSIDEE
jgi:acetyltransferase-like isoleucine patch superfamily enzyme